MEFPQDVVYADGEFYRLGGPLPGPSWEALSTAEIRWLVLGLRAEGQAELIARFDAATRMAGAPQWAFVEPARRFEFEALSVYRRRRERPSESLGPITDLRSLTIDEPDSEPDPKLPVEPDPEIVPVTVRFVDLRLHDWQWRRMAACGARLHTPVTTASETCDDAGEVSFRIHSVAEASDGTLETSSPEHDYHRARSVHIEELEPIDQPVGQRARLDNLGYVGVLDDDDDGPSVYAIEEFQCDHGLPVDGSCNAATRAKLLEVHGH